MNHYTLSLAGSRNRRNRRNRTKLSQRGYDMLQLSLGLIILAVLAAVVFGLFNSNLHSTSESKNANQITGIAGGLKRNLGAQNLYADVTTSMAVSQGIIPKELATSTSSPWTAGNSYGGAITIVPNAAGLSTPNDSATLTWPNVDGSECNDLVISTQNVARQITVGTTVVKPTDGTLNMANLATACDAASTSTVIYQVGR
jgi:Tfp pilus assembly protein FimT